MSESSGFKVAFNIDYEYQVMTDIVKGLVEVYPGLVTHLTISKSFQGRDMWLIEVTNKGKDGELAPTL